MRGVYNKPFNVFAFVFGSQLLACQRFSTAKESAWVSLSDTTPSGHFEQKKFRTRQKAVTRRKRALKGWYHRLAQPGHPSSSRYFFDWAIA